MRRQLSRAFTTLPNPHASFISHHENLLSVMDFLLIAIMRRQLSRAFTTLQSPLASFLMWRQYGRAFTTPPNPHASFISFLISSFLLGRAL